MGHQGQIKDKIQAIENVDQRVLKPLLQGCGDRVRIPAPSAAGSSHPYWKSVPIQGSRFPTCSMTVETG